LYIENENRSRQRPGHGKEEKICENLVGSQYVESYMKTRSVKRGVVKICIKKLFP